MTDSVEAWCPWGRWCRYGLQDNGRGIKE